ncbi:hypothetical protein JCM17846_31130 [Iodidimonas nitroreducens]|uniref:TNase-like domain-containing protein n=1 Tax=Iodidimonas nitroreducens TaxID=1236968 RepID=A0A5A7NAM9_9PROT|nr:hypothetical protein JCM17846_31130 [Iodidimonas nitroreducens]
MGPPFEAILDRVDPDLALISRDGRSFVLADLWRLSRSHEGGDVREDGWARMAHALISTHLGQRFWVYPTSDAPDRYGRIRAHILFETPEGNSLWINAALLKQGLARAFPLDLPPDITRALYEAEDSARADHRTLWSAPAFAPMKAHDLMNDGSIGGGDFAIVTGRVFQATKVGGTLYLNFTADWRQDFTIRLNWPVRRQWPVAERTAAFWRGKELEVRGVMEPMNGLMITPISPAQIKILASPLADEEQDHGSKKSPAQMAPGILETKAGSKTD